MISVNVVPSNSPLLTGDNKSYKNNITLQFFPNPTNSVITVKTNKSTQLSLQNYLGEVVFQTFIQNQSSIDLSQLSKGIYFAKTGNGECVKLIKE